MIINDEDVRIVEESDLINEDQPHYYTYGVDENGVYIVTPRFNARFYYDELEFGMSVVDLVDGLNDGSIIFKVTI